MTAKEILKLIDAGFTKQDIMTLEGSKIVPDPKPEEKKAPEVKPEPETKPEPEEPKALAAPVGVTLSDDQFTKLLQQLNVSGASLDVPPESDMATKLGDHFKDILIGK